jgi:hypothetical protein
MSSSNFFIVATIPKATNCAHCHHNTYSYITIVLPTLQWYHICHAQPSILEMSSIEFENKTQQRIVIAIVYEHIMDYVYIVAKTQMGTKLWQHLCIGLNHHIVRENIICYLKWLTSKASLRILVTLKSSIDHWNAFWRHMVCWNHHGV